MTDSKDGYWEKRLGDCISDPTVRINGQNGHYYEIAHYTHGYELRHYQPKKATAAHPNPEGCSCRKTYHGTFLCAAMRAADFELQHVATSGQPGELCAVVKTSMEATRKAIIEAMGIEHVPEKANTEQPSVSVPQMTEKAHGKPYEKFIAKGWTDELLIAHGLMRAI